MPREQSTEASLLDAAEALALIRATLRDIKAEAEFAHRTPPPQPEALRAAVEAVGQDRPARQLVCPEEYLRQWQEVRAGQRPELEPRAIRYLCWESDVATDHRFSAYLDHSKVDLRARSIQGLVRCCHTRWGDHLFGTSGPARDIRNRLRRYDGPNRIIRRWQTRHELVLGHKGPAEFAADMTDNRRSPKDQCAHWAIDPQSRFFEQSIGHAAARFRADKLMLAKSPEYALHEIFFWAGWSLEKFKQQVGDLILSPATNESAAVSALLRQLVLGDERLRDPRLPANAKNWKGVREEARDRFIGWLSKDDIEFFFEHVLPSRADEHGRKPFWLKYVQQVQRSRPLLCWEDRQRLLATKATMREQIGNFGRIEGTTSAFLLDFGRVLVVEFSRIANACHIYQASDARTVVPDFWTDDPFSSTGPHGLKQRVLAESWIPHHDSWEVRAAQTLARFGIRAR